MAHREIKIATTRFLQMCLQTSLLLASIFHTGISSVKADVRCYCNLPVCVTSGYMCKSSQGMCISDHLGFNENSFQSRHGCIELISQNEQEMTPLDCPKSHQLNQVSERDTFLKRICCTEDMCNYYRYAVDSQNPSYKLNHSFMTGYLSNEDSFFRHSNHNRSDDKSVHKQLWFKAAVIAVPIAGGFILIMLIIMAARMLRADHKRHKEWTELRRQRRLNTHVVYTGEKLTSNGLLFLPKSLSCTVLGSDRSFQHSALHKGFASSASLVQPSGVYKNVSIALSTDTDISRDKYFVFDL